MTVIIQNLNSQTIDLAKHTATINDPAYLKHILRRKRKSMMGEYVIKASYTLLFLSWFFFSASHAHKSIMPIEGMSDYLLLAGKALLYLIISFPLVVLTIVIGTVLIDFLLALFAFLGGKLRPLLFRKSIALEELWEAKRDEVVRDINNLSVGIRDRISQKSQQSNYEFLKNYQKLEPEVGQSFIEYYEKNSTSTPN